ERADGGARTYTFAYTASGNATGYNSWSQKTVETLPDGSQNIVYTNFLTQVLLKEFKSGTDSWVKYYQYNDRGRLLLAASPAAVVSYDDAAADLDVTLQASSGLLQRYEYAETTGDGAVAGYLTQEFVQEGTSGDLIPQLSYEYATHTAGGITVHPVSRQTRYRQEDGTGLLITTTDTTFHSGTVQAQQKVTTLPIVPAEQNGTGLPVSARQYLDLNGRVTWQMDARGVISHTVYDEVTGGVLQRIQDVDTEVVSGAPPYWSTPPGAGLNLVTDNVLDARGRVIQSLGPAHAVDIGGTSVTVRQASWTVYNEDLHVTYSAQGYYDVVNDTSTLINPVSITQRDAGGKVLASIAAVSSSTSGTLQAIITAAGGGAAAFPQSSYVRWQTTQYTECCLIASQRVYFNIPSSGEGASGTNYNQTTYGYDTMRRRNRTV
ncbi:MAG: hypothetical protein KDB77_12955, partial [Flavobacteriales bacterium]|nr:hypothetical protein [Flavobacteriales bacterium]